MNEKKEKIIRAMEEFGGSFVKALALAYRRADLENKKRLEKCFKDVFDRYSFIADRARIV